MPRPWTPAATDTTTTTVMACLVVCSDTSTRRRHHSRSPSSHRPLSRPHRSRRTLPASAAPPLTRRTHPGSLCSRSCLPWVLLKTRSRTTPTSSSYTSSSGRSRIRLLRSARRRLHRLRRPMHRRPSARKTREDRSGDRPLLLRQHAELEPATMRPRTVTPQLHNHLLRLRRAPDSALLRQLPTLASMPIMSRHHLQLAPELHPPAL